MFKKVKKSILSAALLFAASYGLSTTPVSAADSCGYFAFAGAFRSFETANQRANAIGGAAWGLDSSNSPNAGRGLWVVAKGPGSRGEANHWRNEYRAVGIGDAYVANRCFYGE